MEKLLQQVGLTHGEAKVYIALLEIGETTSTAVINKTGLHKGTVYEILGRLIEKNLAAYIIRNGKRYFIPSKPTELLKIVKRKEDILNKEMSKLLALEEKSNKPKIRISEGVLSLKSEVEEVAASSEFFSIGMTGRAFELLKYRMPILIKKMSKNPRFKAQVLLNENQKDEDWFKYFKLFPKGKVEVRFIPDNYQFPLISMWGNTVSFGVGAGCDKPISIVVEDKLMAKKYKSLFKHLWEKC